MRLGARCGVPVLGIDYIQRQDVPLGQGNDRIPLYRLMGFSTATDVVHHRRLNQLFGRVGIYVEVHNLCFETRSSTDVAFTCDINRHKTYSVAALATTVALTGPAKWTNRDKSSLHILESMRQIVEDLRQSVETLNGISIGATSALAK